MNTEERIRKQYTDENKWLKWQLSYKGEHDFLTTKKSLAKARTDLWNATQKLKDDEVFKKKWSNLPPGIPVIDSAL